MSLTTRPLTPAPAHDLTDAEFAELDELLAATPEPLEPLDVVMLDGYLCGVIVQPMLLESATWLAHVFDFEGRPLPDDVDAAWLQRTTALIMRRHGVLTRSLAEDGWFDPLVLEDGDEAAETAPDVDPAKLLSDSLPGVDASADAGAEAVSTPDAISRALMPWVAGFQQATVCFPDLDEMPDDAVMAALARLYRHLPAETDEELELVATLEREQPLATLDEAMQDLVANVADLFDLTSEQRYKVDTVRREAPKVGRNDACPCGSGKKFKHCHGAA
ncbi:MAG: UPF0149 family protein [Caldimonas sp.]